MIGFRRSSGLHASAIPSEENAMSVRQITVPVAGNAPAVLPLPQPMTPEALDRFERAVTATNDAPAPWSLA